jgi:hypothetical protein
MLLAFTFTTANKISPLSKEKQYSNAVNRNFGTAEENYKPHLASVKSVEVPDEKKNIAGTLGLIELAKWAQEQKWEWKGSPNVGANHDAYVYEAIKEDLEAEEDDDDEMLEAERRTSA